MKTEETRFWVVYRMALPGKRPGANAVRPQSEWDAMERAQPGYHTLVRAGIASEAEAERLARAASDGTAAGQVRLKAR
jgi:hypothetical protein